MLEGILVSFGRTRSFGSPVHPASSLTVGRWRIAGRPSSGLGTTPGRGVEPLHITLEAHGLLSLSGWFAAVVSTFPTMAWPPEDVPAIPSALRIKLVKSRELRP